NNDIGWLLPLGVLGFFLLVSLAWHSRSTAIFRQLALWGGWLLTCGIVFSAAVFPQTHYVATLAPALAALAAIGLQQLWHLYRKTPFIALAILVVLMSGLVAWQANIALQYLWQVPWFFIVVIPMLAGGLFWLFASALWHWKGAAVGFACLV